jgi:hypothetical protein
VQRHHLIGERAPFPGVALQQVRRQRRAGRRDAQAAKRLLPSAAGSFLAARTRRTTGLLG